jgi:6-pyruvoyl-tetrahydropterin synthase
MSTYEVSVQGVFHAGHSVRLPDGSCEPPHEHDWQVTATFRANRLDETMGVVVDFLEVESSLQAVMAQLEGKDLNSLAAFSDGRPSAERVAEYVAKALAFRLGGDHRLYRLAVTEAPGCGAAYYPNGA